MKRSKKSDEKRRKTSSSAKARRRKPEELTVAKRYTSIPSDVVEAMSKFSRIYGSQGRAWQVATEILIRMKKRPLPAPESSAPLTAATYKLTPRTVELIDELADSVYKNRQQVFTACVQALKMTDI